MMLFHKSEKIILILTLALTAVFVFSLLFAKSRYRIDLPECVPYDRAFEQAKVEQLDAKTYRIFAVASMWRFEPAEIQIPAGSTVDLFLVSKDVVHGFHIYEKNVNMMAIYGALNKTTVTFEKPGIYDIVCHEYCGIGHHFMKGQITVVAQP